MITKRKAVKSAVSTLLCRANNLQSNETRREYENPLIAAVLLLAGVSGKLADDTTMDAHTKAGLSLSLTAIILTATRAFRK